jgi:hypothetical protein
MRQTTRRAVFLGKLQGGLYNMVGWHERWNIKINEDKTWAIYFSHRRAPPDSLLTSNIWNISFGNNLKYLGVIFDKRITWRLHIERIAVRAFRTLIRLSSFSKVRDSTLTLN